MRMRCTGRHTPALRVVTREQLAQALHAGDGEMTNEALAQVERLIADCKKRIERQREVVANGFQKGHDTDIAISMLRALEASLSAFEKHRQFILDRQKTADRR
jgi:hypothetical protein